MIVRVFVLPAALSLIATAAVAQDPPAGNAGVLVAPGDFPWETITVEWIERRYKIEAIRFTAHDETGIDWLGSDEVTVQTTDAKGWTTSYDIDDIDSGDIHEFNPAVSCIVGIRPRVVVLGENSVCDEAGEPGPFSFGVSFYERDSSRDFVVCEPAPPPGHHAGGLCPRLLSFSDFIGWRELFFPIRDLEAALPNVGDSFTETVALDPCPRYTLCTGWFLPDYSFTYRTTRLPDVRTDFRDQLFSAMDRSGIGTAGDAIAAGLRSLSTPEDRRAEREVDQRIDQPDGGTVAFDY